MLRANFTEALHLAKKVITLLRDLRNNTQICRMLEFLETRFRHVEIQATQVRDSPMS